MQNRLSIIVPVYKIKEEYLYQCLESLNQQNRDDYQVILVDDGSPDRCGAICDEFAKKNDVFYVIHQENQGVSIARNTALEYATTEWVTFVDADDWVDNNYVDKIYKILDGEARGADIVMFDYIREFKDSRPLESLGFKQGFLDRKGLEICKLSTFYKLKIDNKFNSYETITLWNKIYRLSFIKGNNISFVKEALKGQDRLFNADALNTTNTIFYVPVPLYHYRCFRTSRTNKFDSKIPQLTIIELENLKQIVRKHKIEENANVFVTCRVCTRLYANLRLFYFHDNNPKSLREKIKDVALLISREPYKEALATVDASLLSFPEKLFVFSLKYKLFFMCFILVKIKDGLFNKKLF
jgi:glycosyltransferase involved in cell wall biosynthesis